MSSQTSPTTPVDGPIAAGGPVQPFTVTRLSDVVPLSVLQTLLTGLATQHGIPLTIVEPDGEGFRYIRPHNENLHRARFCRLYAATDDGRRRCLASDFDITRSIMAHGPKVGARWLQCHMGLAEVAIPIVVADRVVAVLFTGHRRLPGTEDAIREQARRHARNIPDLDADALCEAVEEIEPLDEARMDELARALEGHAEAIAKLGRDRYNVERRLRQELLLNELMVGLARPCAGERDLEARLEAAMARVTEFFRIRYSAIYTQTFPRAPELTAAACAGDCPSVGAEPLMTPDRPAMADGEATYHIITDREEIAAFLTANGSPAALKFADAQAVICDHGDPAERVTVTIFGPQREGHTESLLSTAGDDFLERFQFEVGMRSKVARLLLDLRRRNEDQTQFLAQTTHEVNAGLQTIVEEAEWLLYYVDELGEIDDPEVAEPLHKILSEVMRLGARSRSSLFHLRGGMPRTEYNLREAHALDNVIAASVEPFRSVALSRNITIHVEDSVRALPRTVFDWDMMKIAFMNLVDNAVKYSHFNRTIRIHGEADEQWVSVSVEDFGLGIPPDEHERIFEPYVRGTQRDPRRFIWGSGLGLAVARDIIEAHGGSIEVKSVPTAKAPVTDPQRAWENHLTTFTVRLPLRQEA